MKTMNSNISSNQTYRTLSSLGDSAYATTWNLDFSDLINKEDKEKIISDLLDKEDDLMPILKKYLVGYLDKIMENPDSIIDKLIKEKDTEIKELKDRVNKLEEKVNSLENSRLNIPTPLGPSPLPYPTNPYTPWGVGEIYCSDSSSSNCISDAIYNYNAANSIYNTSSTASISTSV